MSKDALNDVRAAEDERVMHKNAQKVLTAIKSDPFGLSVSQIANNTRLSVKTVRNVIATLDEAIDNGLGIFTIKDSTNNQPELVNSETQPDVPQNEKEKLIDAPADNPPLDISGVVETKAEVKTSTQKSEVIKIVDPDNNPETVTDPFEQYKSMVETVTVEKKSVSLTSKQLSNLLQDLFGLKNVQFFAEGQSITRLSAQLSDEVML